MKRIVIAAVALMACMAAAAQTAGNDRHLSAIFSYSTFYGGAEMGPYAETYISFDAWNLNFVKTGNQQRATVEVLMVLTKNDSVEWAKKYDLHSPTVAVGADLRFNFLDVQRFPVSNGIHKLSVKMRDKNSEDPVSEIEEQLLVNYDRKHAQLSSVQMMASVKPTKETNILSRSGYDMEPYVNDFLPEQIDKVNFYYEIYNLQNELRDKVVYSISYIETQETGKVLEETKTAQRQTVEPQIPVFGSIDISTLPSGNYNLVVEVRNHSNEVLLYKRVPFFRSNPGVKTNDKLEPEDISFAGRMTDEKQLDEWLEALYPICKESERASVYSLIKRPDLQAKQRFMYRFWVERSPLNPESAWLEYRDRIDYVNEHFSWLNVRGFRTDRGRVYLQYGPPNFVRDEKNFVSTRHLGSGVNTPAMVREARGEDGEMGITATVAQTLNNSKGHIYYLPYQIWRYDQLPGDDPKRCFLFWDEFRSGHYKLLTSSAKGEVREADWERRLSQQQLDENTEGEVGEQFRRGY